MKEEDVLNKMVEELEAQRRSHLKDRDKDWFEKLGGKDEDRD